MTERDLSVFFLPPRLLWVDAIQHGEFPLWNPYYYSGHPLLAALQPAVFYPFNTLLLILPFDLAFNWIIILHFFLAGLFTFLLLKELQTSITGALIASLVFMLSGYLISVHNLLSTLLSVTWVPLTIFLYLRAIKRISLNYAVLTGIALAIMFTGGGIEVVYGTLGLLLFMALLPETFLSLCPGNPPLSGVTEGDEGNGGRFSASTYSSKNCASLTRRIVYLLVSVLIFISLSAIQLLPFLELSQYSIRAGGLSYHEATTWSMDLKDLIQFFIPDPYGYGTSETKYWSNQSWLKTIYIGTIPFILSAFFFIERGRKTLPFILVLFLSFTLAFGKNSLIYEYLYAYLPFFNKIRYPVKFLFIAFVFVSISAGLGLDSFRRNIEEGRKSGRWIIVGLLGLATIVAIAFGLINYFDREVKDFLIEHDIKYPEYNDVHVNVFNTKRLLAIFVMTVLILYSSLRIVRMRKAVPYLIVLFVTIDLFFAHFGYYFATKAEEYHKNSESMDFILKDKGELFRIFITPKTKKGQIVVSATEKNIQNEPDSLPDIGKEIIQGYNLEKQIFDIDGIEVMRFTDYEKVFLFLTEVPKIDSTNLLDFLNVNYVLSVPKIESKEFKLVKVIMPGLGKDRKKLEKEGFLKIYKNLNYLPRAFLVEKYMVITKEEYYKNIMKSKEFKPAEMVLLYENPWDNDSSEFGLPIDTSGSTVRSSELVKTKTNAVKEQKKRENEVTILDYRNNSIQLNVNTDRPKILVLSETYYPGWKVYVDGQEKKILKANFAFRAVPLSAGQHKVEFIYDPWTFKIGLYITLLTIISLLSFGILKTFIYRI